MTYHSAADAVAPAVRAEMARQQKLQAELAEVLGLTPHTVGRRLNGTTPFTVVELYTVAKWLGIPLSSLLPSNQTVAS